MHLFTRLSWYNLNVLFLMGPNYFLVFCDFDVTRPLFLFRVCPVICLSLNFWTISYRKLWSDCISSDSNWRDLEFLSLSDIKLIFFLKRQMVRWLFTRRLSRQSPRNQDRSFTRRQHLTISPLIVLVVMCDVLFLYILNLEWSVRWYTLMWCLLMATWVVVTKAISSSRQISVSRNNLCCVGCCLVTLSTIFCLFVY